MAAVSSCTFVFTSHIQPHYLNRFVKKRFKSVNRGFVHNFKCLSDAFSGAFCF